ncbi:cytochrome c peroxidase [Sorangium sp. So ce124]|uniref:cytochrome c peroxidase n=1 Tax=Sorangium sp. So ce124 TaxID=3133280 RepID=UPI003F628C11
MLVRLQAPDRSSSGPRTARDTSRAQSNTAGPDKPREFEQPGRVSDGPLPDYCYLPVFTWANPILRSLEEQARVPIFGDFPIELGATGDEEMILARFRGDPRYQELFREAYPKDDDPFTFLRIVEALATFERMLVSGDSPFDRYVQGLDDDALSRVRVRVERLLPARGELLLDRAADPGELAVGEDPLPAKLHAPDAARDRDGQVRKSARRCLLQGEAGEGAARGHVGATKRRGDLVHFLRY